MVDEFDGDDVEVRAIVDSAQTPPFLTERRVVVARDVGRFTADEVAPLVAYLGDPLPTTELVLVGGGGRVAKALSDAVKRSGGTVRSTDPPTRARDRQGWVGEHATSVGVKLAPAAAALVAERLGEDVGRLDGLLATLAATFGSPPAASGGRRAVHRRGRRRAAVGAHRCRRRRQHRGRARRARAHERARDAPSPAADGDPARPLRAAGPPRRGRGGVGGAGRRRARHQAGLPGQEGPDAVPAPRWRRRARAIDLLAAADLDLRDGATSPPTS